MIMYVPVQLFNKPDRQKWLYFYLRFPQNGGNTELLHIINAPHETKINIIGRRGDSLVAIPDCKPAVPDSNPAISPVYSRVSHICFF
jgi:hypothetical protein